jgi:hypothetical protein
MPWAMAAGERHGHLVRRQASYSLLARRVMFAYQPPVLGNSSLGMLAVREMLGVSPVAYGQGFPFSD